MGLPIESRPADSPYVDRVWRSRSGDDVDRMTSLATPHWELVVWEHRGRTEAAVRGPESRVSRAPVPAEAAFFGISFALGTALAQPAVDRLVDGAVELAAATDRTFWLAGSARQFPGYDDAEFFVRRLVREGVLVRDPIVVAALAGQPPRVSERTVQRHFLATTGLTRGAVERIDRARRAAVLLQDGVPAGETAHRLGYFDQPHLARSLTRFIGRTATQLGTGSPAEPLSLLYKT